MLYTFQEDAACGDGEQRDGYIADLDAYKIVYDNCASIGLSASRDACGA